MRDSSLHNDNSSICLDGAEVKRLRESQGLTQLYVSKVVGVTTDTISRWENNRYPTIRRDNALKLAEALEVSLDDLLRRPDEPAPSAPRRNQRRRYQVAALVLLVVLTAIFLVNRRVAPPPPVTVSAQRHLPVHAAPDTAIPVMIELSRQPDNEGFILRESFPKGWQLLQASPPAASLDNVNGVARWIIKSTDPLERIVYLVRVVAAPTEPDAGSVFHGEVIVGGGRSQSQLPVDGATGIAVAPIHWADDNGDGRIDDAEMLKASFTIEDMAGVHIDWDRLERLWDAGSYRWDADKVDFVPLPPQPSASD